MKALKTILLTILIIIIAALGTLMLVPVSSVSVTGNDYYTDTQIESYVFENDFSRRAFMVLVRSVFGVKAEVPFVSRISIKLTGLTSAKITVSKKNMLGYAALPGRYIYFDENGTVIEESKDLYPNLPELTGLKLDKAQIGMKLPIESVSVFNELLGICRFISVTDAGYLSGSSKLLEHTRGIGFDDSENIFLHIDDITVSLGIGYNLDGKLIEMTDILPSLAGKKGTLHLEGFDPADTNHVYLFD